MTSKASSLLSSVMSSIDELKDKINDGEYLNLCNLLKALNDEIKTPSETLRQAAIAAMESYESSIEDRGEGETESEEEETNQSIEQRLRELINNPRYFDDNNNYIVNPREILNDYNNLLLAIEEEYEENDDHQWFHCACGRCVRTSDISEHITTESHIENFTMWRN